VARVVPTGCGVDTLLNPMRWPPALAGLVLGALTVGVFGVGYAVGQALPLP
jgi:hypothetical protein